MSLDISGAVHCWHGYAAIARVLLSTHARVAGLAAGGAHKTLFGFEIVENMCERAHAEPRASAGNAHRAGTAP